MLELEWDEAKNLLNGKKHGIDFNDLYEFFESDLYTKLDSRFNYGETRFLTFGLLAGHVLAVSHTETESTIRVISARKANRNEQKEYFQKVRN